MANELIIGSGGASILFDASRVSDMFMEMIADKDISIMAHPAFMYLGDMAGAMTAVSKIPIVDLSDDEFASLTEIQTMTPSDITSALATITTSRRGLMRSLGDFARAIDGTQALDEIAIASALVLAANLTLLSICAVIVATYTSISGISGATMTHDTVRSAKQTLRSAYVKGPYVCIMAPKQYNEWETDFQSLGGSVQMTDQGKEMAELTGGSYQGSWDGIDFYISSKVVDDGTDFLGGMWGMGALGWKSLSMDDGVGQITIMDAGFVKIEADRNAPSALSSMVGNMYVGAGKIQDSGGVVLRSAS